ncbi:hypothetical protein [Orbus wheelerorum]|uniref:hypothetical protein n=1 Tax=Orbus wheelerorum TaxID=3074111 RepID=UPI00370D5D8D
MGCIALSGAVSGSAMAVDTPAKSGTDLSALTDSIDFSGVLTAIMAIAGTLVALYAGYVGVRWVLRMVKGA